MASTEKYELLEEDSFSKSFDTEIVKPKNKKKKSMRFPTQAGEEIQIKNEKTGL